MGWHYNAKKFKDFDNETYYGIVEAYPDLAEDEAKLLKLLLVVALSLKTGLSLMGIEAKDKMSKEED